MPQYFVTSATESLGKEEVLNYIDEVNQGSLEQQSVLNSYFKTNMAGDIFITVIASSLGYLILLGKVTRTFDH
jgi:hypothetical protein